MLKAFIIKEIFGAIKNGVKRKKVTEKPMTKPVVVTNPVVVKQPSSMPTRKMWAVILSGIIVGAIQSVVTTYWPDNFLFVFLQDHGIDYEQLDIFIQAALMSLAGYMTKSRNINAETP